MEDLGKDQPVGVQRITDAAIVPSEKTSTVACKEFWMLMRHRAIRKDKHGGVQQIRMLMQHRTVKKDERLGVQRIPDADTASCRRNIGLLRHRAYLSHAGVDRIQLRRGRFILKKPRFLDPILNYRFGPPR